MRVRHFRRSIFIVLLGLWISVSQAASLSREQGQRETVIAGGPDKFAEVRHIVLRGSNFEIGRKVGEVAKKDGVTIVPSGNQTLNRAKREYMAAHYPVHYERMKGLAAAYGLNISDDSYDFSGLSQRQMAPPGCSVVFYPAGAMENGHDILSRNYDFTTGDITGRRPQGGRLAMMARPYLMEIHPDKGYSSLALCAFEYFGGVLDGINSEGLAVAILAEEESGNKAGREPGDEVGVHELMGMRYLLDNCRNVAEAKRALLSLKHYYSFIPCHYIVGDRSGKSFIFEFSPARDRSHVLDGDGPQFVTNHLVHLHPKVEEFPATGLTWSMRRYKMLAESIKAKKTFTLEDIEAINNSVAVPPQVPANPQAAPARTLWYAQYDLDSLTLTVKFYLGEKPDLENEKRAVLEYSPRQTFELKK